MVITCNGSGLNTYISSYAYVGQTVNGVTTFGNSILLASSSVNYHDLNEQFGSTADSRWGDYSTVSVDPSDPTHFWTIQMLPDLRHALTYSATATPWCGRRKSPNSSPACRRPQLSISLTGTNALISWAGPAVGFQLQSNTNLSSSIAWSNVSRTLSTNGNIISVTVPVSGKQQFFRLKQ